MAKVQQYDIPTSEFAGLQAGKDYTSPDGNRIPNDELTVPNPKARSYAYTADTMYEPSITQYFQGADLLYHESTYLHELHVKAGQRFHATARQAGMIAQQAGVKRLLIGHYSSQYETTDELMEEAKAVFPNTTASVEGVTYRI